MKVRLTILFAQAGISLKWAFETLRGMSDGVGF